MAAYYNEIDPKAAAWLRELIRQGHIAPGEVDERSIEDVIPSELMEFTQCHFFAGIGVWSYALRRAGWPDDRPVWTGSCPCQPFSAAGKGKGIADERHLWPALYHLIRQCKPGVVFGEQVAGKDGLGWLDIVQADLEAARYSVGAVDLCSAGLGAPHIRQRLYWVADAFSSRRQSFTNVESSSVQRAGVQSTELIVKLGYNGAVSSGVANTSSQQEYAAATGRLHPQLGGCGDVDRMADADNPRPQRRSVGRDSGRELPAWQGGMELSERPGPTNGFWGAADWLQCRDGKWRAVEPGTFPLVNGTSARVGRLRGYGNAIVAPVAQAFIEAYLEAE